MTAKLLRDGGLDPTIIVGGRVLTQATGASLGTGQYLVAEADESDGSFCLLRPAIAVVTNIDAEHMEHYGSFEALEQAFRNFACSVPFYGLVVACADDAPTRKAMEKLPRRVCTYGFSNDCDIFASEMTAEGPHSRYTLNIAGEAAAEVTLPMPGRHMVLNSLAAAAVALELGVFPQEISESLKSFPGVSRRTERVGEAAGVLVLDDYAHHPTEIAATLSAVRRGFLPQQAKSFRRGSLGRLHVVFEPHRYTRTRDLFDYFRDAFIDADTLYLGDIYPAGEQAIEGVNGKSLAAAISTPPAVFCENLSSTIDRIVESLAPGDVVITLGAGAIGKLAVEVLQALSEKTK
jgi:UDP-N-acetylmuramate--alanine ligase